MEARKKIRLAHLGKAGYKWTEKDRWQEVTQKIG